MECYLNVAINFQASLCIQKHIYMHIYVHMFTTKTRMTTRARPIFFVYFSVAYSAVAKLFTVGSFCSISKVES